jgi:hypothetical protein
MCLAQTDHTILMVEEREFQFDLEKAFDEPSTHTTKRKP